jgi:hypothetical protein
MLDQLFIRKLDQGGCQEYMESLSDQLRLTLRRIEIIRKKQKANPNFEAYDRWADGMVGIDIRLEEQLAVRDDLESDLTILTARLDSLLIRKEHPNCKLVTARTAQLSLFDLGVI